MDKNHPITILIDAINDMNLWTPEITLVDRFLDQKKIMIKLLTEAKNVSFIKTKTSISISNLVKIRAGDTFRVRY